MKITHKLRPLRSQSTSHNGVRLAYPLFALSEPVISGTLFWRRVNHDNPTSDEVVAEEIKRPLENPCKIRTA